MKLGDTVAELGLGDYDGQRAVLSAGGERVRLRWHEDASAWVGDPQVLITFDELDPMAPLEVEGSWRYLSQVVSAGTYAYSWSPRAIRGADALYAAGLTLQEKIDADFWIFDPGGVYDLAVVYYSMDDGDTIDPSIVPEPDSPGRNVGTSLPGVPTVRCITSTGWVANPIDTPTKANLAPHLYTLCTDNADGGGARVERLQAFARWVGQP